jgi:hypothetical protein
VPQSPSSPPQKEKQKNKKIELLESMFTLLATKNFYAYLRFVLLLARLMEGA